MNQEPSMIKGDYIPLKKSILIFKDTKLKKETSPSFTKSNYFKMYQQLRQDGVIDDDHILLKDYEFSSVSLAASLIRGVQTNGVTHWMVDENTSLKDYLERDITLDSQKDQEAVLHEFLKDIDVLETINPAETFNVFTTLKIVNAEIRHSNVLAWLLDPYESHGLKGFFAKHLVREIYLDNSNFLKKMDASSVFLWDFDQVEIYREKDNIDILLIDNEHHFILAIENKIYSKEHHDQLSRYKEIIKKRYPIHKYKHFFVYLTAEDEDSSDDEWMTISYELILRILQKSLPLLKDKMKLFIEDYITIIRRNIMEDEKLAKLCREIYLKHRDALELIYQFRPDHNLELTEYIKEKISETALVTLNQSRKNLIRFASHKLTVFNNQHRKIGHKWVKDNSIMLYEIKIQARKIVLVLVIGPTKDDTRNQILEKFIDLSKARVSKTNKWTTLDRMDVLTIANIENLETINAEIDKKLLNKIHDFIQRNDAFIERL